MAERFANNAKSELNGAVTSGASIVTVANASTFPSSGNFRILVELEIMLVIAVSGPAFTVTRAYEAIGGLQVAAAHPSGAAVQLLITAGSLQTLFAGSQAPSLANVAFLGGMF